MAKTLQNADPHGDGYGPPEQWIPPGYRPYSVAAPVGYKAPPDEQRRPSFRGRSYTWEL